MDYVLLSKTPLFRGLTPEHLNAILDKIPFRIKKFQAGSMAAQSGEPVNGLMIILKGTLKGEMSDYAGRVIKIEDIPAPGVIASAFMFGNRSTFPVNVTAISDAELLYIEKSDFLRMLKTNDSLLINFLDMISNRSQFLSEKIKFLSFKTIRGKLANFILQKSGKTGSIVSLDMTQSELADFFGVTRPSVARSLGELEHEGYIEARGKNIKITDMEGLAELTSE